MIRVTVNNRGVQAIPLSPVTVGAEGIVAAFLFSDDWAGLAKTAIFKGSGEEVEKIVLNNECAVPPEVLAEAGGMLQVGVYGNDGHGTTIRPTVWGVVGRIEDGAISEDAGQTGTTPSWAAQLQNAVQEAITTANNAVIAAEENADDSEAWAVGTRDEEAIPETDPAYQNYAKYWAERAAASATEGAESASTASSKASEAAASASTASNKAGEAATSASNAATSAEAANTAKTAAQNAQTAAEQAKAGAETARDASSSSASQAAESATQAAGSASDAAQSATAAQGSESAAATSAQNAAASEAAAATSARNAGNSASAAATSETNAANSATAAAGSAGNAATSEQNASASATAAANSVTAAQTAQSAAEDAQGAAETAAASVSSSAAQIAQNTSDISDLNRHLSDLEDTVSTTQIINTASGAIASFDDGADGQPIRKLVAQIEPVQDLHGYDNPWPAGGGKNKLQLAGPTHTINGITFTFNGDGTVTVDGTATANAFHTVAFATFLADAPSGTYILNGCPSGGSGYNLDVQGASGADTGDGVTITYSGELTNTNVRIRVYEGTTVNNAVFKPMIRLATETDATFAPYENICPISGHTGAEIERAGVNIWDEEWDRGYVDGANGGAFMAYPAYVRSKHKFRIDGGKTYYFACSRSGTLGNTGISYYDANGDFISSDVDPVNSAFTAPTKAKMMAFFVPSSWYTGDYANDISINYPATDTDYHPYTGNQISVNWEDEAGTVYGGEDEVISGKLKKTMGMADLGDLVWEESGGTGDYHKFFFTNSLRDNCTGNGGYNEPPTNIFCSAYKNGSRQDVYFISAGKDFVIGCESEGTIYLYDSTKEDLTAEEFKSAVQGIQLVYQLRTPVEYTLDGEELTTLYGTNNIWANTGDTSVEYCADTKLYIDGKITQAIANALNS